MPHGDHSEDPQTGEGEVRIGNHWYPLLGGVSEQPLARWPPKVTFGDYAKDSDPLVSAYVMSSFTGGIGNFKIKAGVEDDTYWTGTLETRYPEGPTLLPLSESFSAPSGTYSSALPLGDFPAASPDFLVAFDEDVHSWDESADAFVSEAVSLGFTPVDRGVEYRSEFWVPYGGNGYGRLTSGLVLSEFTDIEPLQFIVWDKKLMALTTDGELRQWHTNDLDWSETEWALTGENRTLPTGNRPRRLVNFINSQGVPTLYVVTDNLVFAYDPDSDELYETRLDYPRHPNQGRAATNFRGDTMFVNVGLGIHGYNGSIITSMGPDGRYGLPAHLRGTIVDLFSEYNGIFALIEGKPNPEASVASEEYISQAPLYGNENTWAISNFPYQPVFGSIYRWNNSQWHPVWESSDAGGTPTLMYVSQAQNAYRLWWGYGGEMYSQEISIEFQNPKQSLLSQSMRFMPTGQLITGWFDADMTAFHKLASHIEVNIEDVFGDGTTGGSVSVAYQIDNESGWRLLGEATVVGRTNMPFANESREVGDPFSHGRAFHRIRFRIALTQDASSQYLSPLVESIVFKFHKIPEQTLSWQFSLNLAHEDGYKGVQNNTLIDYLYDLLVTEEFFEFGYLDRTYRVRSAQTAGDRAAGYDNRGTFQMNLVQVTTGPARGDDTTVYVDTYHAD